MGLYRDTIVLAALTAASMCVPEAMAQPSSQAESVALPAVTVSPAQRASSRSAPRRRAAKPVPAPRTAPVAPRAVTSVSNTSDRYLDRRSTAATKTDTPVLETPQSISTITRRQMDDQNAQTVGNALRYTAGVLSDADSNARYDSIFIRGFGAFGTATNYVSFLDGLKLPRGQAFANTSIDPFLLDRVEVLKGPSAVLYGQTSPGGLVNQVSRLPSAVPYNEVRIEGGTYGRIQSGVTSQGALDKDGHWLYSLSAIGRSSGTRYDGVDEQRYAVAPAVTWTPDADTSLTVQSYYQRDPKGGYFNSLYARSLAPAQYQSFLNSKLNVGDPSFDAFQREQYGIGYQFDKRLNSVVSVRSSLRYSHVDIDMQSLQMNAPLTATGQLPRWAVRSIENVGGLSTDNRVQFDLSTGALQHKIITGADYQQSRSDWVYQLGAATSLNVINPVYGQTVGTLTSLINSGQDLSQTGLYAQDQISLGQWRATLGARHDWTEQSTDNRLAGSGTSQSADKTTYRAGLLYLFDNGVAPYVSYSTSFEPVAGVGVDGSPFIPTTAEQYEGGIKYQPNALPILLTASVFDIRQQNVLTPSAVAGFNVQQGEVRSTGVELEARGNVTDGLELIGAVTFLDTRVTQSTTTSIIGNRPQAVPDFFGSVWANYTFRSGPVGGLSVGGGIRHVGASYGDDANTLQTSAYTLVDAALKYELEYLSPRLKGTALTLNVNNLFDKEYYSSCSSTYYCQFGNRRTILAGLRYRW
ncbi:TonB-dependent siderophore receptor [Rhodopseudomonas palustris HaA2]|uniref:TonB-dependent siderophore receptor n=1 Tax=Rhodopseudomonas palustris (strain HaA2) TaxID=316058 RepID=Q2IUZ2_RHOP2|nr:TonB-dependent siderophore receptor [Rhodopseudomonas palustris]ABD07968.1 TonB-dependent siderophore receptor [Rhodopseudomonas palustris HaA2]